MIIKNARFLVVAVSCMLLASGLQPSAADSIPALHDLEAVAGSQGPVIHLHSTGRLETVHYSPQPGVWVVEMPEATWEQSAGFLSEPDLGIERAELQQVEEFGKRVTRLTIWLTAPAQLELLPKGNNFDLIFKMVGANGVAEPRVERESLPVASNEPAEEPQAAVEPPQETPLERAQEQPAEVPMAADAMPSGEPGANLLDVRLVRSGDGVVVELRADGVLDGRPFTLPNPQRVVVDLNGVVNRVQDHLFGVNSPLVRRVRVAQFRAVPEPITRIVVDLEEAAEFQIAPTASGALLTVGTTVAAEPKIVAATPAAVETEMSAPQTGNQPEPTEVAAASDSHDEGQPAVAEPTAVGPTAVEPSPAASQVETEAVASLPAVELEPVIGDDPTDSHDAWGTGESEFVPATDEPVSEAPRDAVTEAETPLINNHSAQVNISDGSGTPMISNEDGGDVAVSNFSAERRLHGEIKASQAATGEQDEDEFVGDQAYDQWGEPRQKERQQRSRSPWVADPSQLIEAAPAAQVLSSPVGGVDSYATTEVDSEERKFTGDPVSLTLKDADIKDVLRTFSTLTNLNIVLDPGVSGSVTVELKNVPWDQALDIILKINGLDYVLENNVLRVASTDKLAAEKAALARLAEERERAKPTKVVIKPLSYAKASELANLLTSDSYLLSQRGSVSIDTRTNTLIIRDIVERVEGVLRLIETLDQPTPQVVIEARVVETTRDFSHTLGMSWGFSGTMDAEHGNDTGLSFPNNVTINGDVNLLRGGQNGVIGLAFGDILNTFNLDVLLQAAEGDGLVRIVSTPRVTTQNLTQASIQSGLQIPIQTVANNTVTVQYTNATLSLEVTPQITAEGTVLLDVNIQKKEPVTAIAVTGGANAPIFTREAQTQLLVRDGGTTVIAGIYQINDQFSEDRVPLLSKIPLLGSIFKNREVFKRHDELLIFITPRIVKY